MFDGEGTRRTLQTLQTSASDGNTLVGNNRSMSLNISVNGVKNFATPTIYQDVEGPIKSTHDDADEDEAYELLVSDAVPDSYWKSLAEERRQALEDSLTENEELHKEIDELQTENSRLTVIAGQAEYLATVLKELIDEEEDDKLGLSGILDASLNAQTPEANRISPDNSEPTTSTPKHSDKKSTDQKHIILSKCDTPNTCKSETQSSGHG